MPTSETIEIECPCCGATLKVDTATGSVLTHKAKAKPPAVGDLAEAANRLKGEASRREEAFRKSLEATRSHSDVLNRKFDELLKQAKSSPDTSPPRRDIDLD